MNKVTTIHNGKMPPAKQKARYHIPSTVQPDTLFHFVSKEEYLIDTLKRRAISPRYCKEDLKYLQLGNVKELAYPMACFCDIGLQRLEQHMDCYGYYGIAFPKKWCMENGFQAVQYLNRDAPLSRDVRKAFKAAMREVSNPESPILIDTLSDYLLHQLMYYKPYQGMTQFRVDRKVHRKCFADECEWRYIPNLKQLGMPLVISNPWTMNKHLEKYNDALKESDAILKFEYRDLKYIMVRNTRGYSELLEEVKGWRNKSLIKDREAYEILSKVLVWDEIKGDF